MAERRFPPPWSVDDPDTKLGQTCYIVRDANGHALAYQGVTCGTPVTKAYCRLSATVGAAPITEVFLNETQRTQ